MKKKGSEKEKGKGKRGSERYPGIRKRSRSGNLNPVN
jgi:hypothetical protein